MRTNRHTIIWQGLKLEIPRRWDPVKLEGDHLAGHALFADTERARLGLRWQTPRQTRKFDPQTAVEKAMQTEVGQLAAAEAKLHTFPTSWGSDPVSTDEIKKGTDPFIVAAHPAAASVTRKGTDPLFSPPGTPNLQKIKGSVPFIYSKADWSAAILYAEPDPPGRDVFCGFSELSGRLVQIAYHGQRRDQALANSILPTLVDCPLDRAAPWSVFDLNCVVPGEMHLKSQRLNAGDLGLTFADRCNEITIRQIAVASLALQRRSIDGWIADQQRINRRYHQPTGLFADTAVTIRDQELPARMSRNQRRLRYGLLWNVPASITTLGLYDADRDRIVLLQGTDESLLREIAQTVGALGG